MRTLKMSIVIVTSFIVCWTPYYLLGLWYWFFPDDMDETVSHSLTHMLFIFGLFNACLDPITYGLFTIHFRHGLKRYCRSTATFSRESENNTTLTGSFRRSPFRLTRLTQQGQTSITGQMAEEEQVKKTCRYSNYLTVHSSGEGDPGPTSPESTI